MKRLIPFLLIAGLGCAVGALLVGRYQAARYAAQLERQQAAWQAEKAEFEVALELARAQARAPETPVLVAATPAPSVAPIRPSPADIMARLCALRPPVAPAQMREAVYWLEELVQAGAAALPAIREFLARNEDIELDTSGLQSRAARDGKLPGEFVLPPSLRMGLFEVVRRIGGEEPEKLLADTLGATGRGLEVAYLTRLLHELAPQKHRDSALSTARALLANTTPVNSSSPLDRNHRDYLFGVLSFYGDASFAGVAQTQLLRADSQIDRGALRYLQQTLGAQAVPIAAQTYQNPLLLTNAAAKEPLARLALNFVGADAQANEFYQQAINDPVLTRGHRSNLIEDLNEDGFADPRNLTANDLPLIQNRIALIEQLAPSAMDQVNAAAFKEAYKDLVNMRAKVTGQPPPTRP
jgi:hypothetical protein